MILYLFQMSPSLNDFPIRLKANSSRCEEASGPLSHVQLFWKKILVTCKQSISILYLFTFEHLYAAMSGQWDLVERRNEGICHLREALEREMMEEALGVLGEKTTMEGHFGVYGSAIKPEEGNSFLCCVLAPQAVPLWRGIWQSEHCLGVGAGLTVPSRASH